MTCVHTHVYMYARCNTFLYPYVMVSHRFDHVHLAKKKLNEKCDRCQERSSSTLVSKEEMKNNIRKCIQGRIDCFFDDNYIS